MKEMRPVKGKIDLAEYLITSQALRIAPANEVFWYTSGTVGPYYINTHYLYGGPEKAEEMLSFINDEKENSDRFVPVLYERCRSMYDNNQMYRTVIDGLVAQVRSKLPVINMVSGGERRDWFFSVAVADQLDLPHLYIYKEGEVCLWNKGATLNETSEVAGRQLVHVADLITEASSYSNHWVPKVRECGGCITYAVNVVDRAQGGADALKALGVQSESLLQVDEELFAGLLKKGFIDVDQHKILVAYYRNPKEAMCCFLNDHPQFVQEALNSTDLRIAKRAQLLVDKKIYGVKSK